MKRLILIRHAKSSWSDISISDHDRDLNERGERVAPKMASWLSSWLLNNKLTVDVLLVSSAVRTVRTAEYIARAIHVHSDSIFQTRALYDCREQDILDQVSWHADEHTQTVLVVGHNPTITNLVHRLTGSGPVNMPTCSIAIVSFSEITPWSALYSGTLEEIAIPRAIFPEL